MWGVKMWELGMVEEVMRELRNALESKVDLIIAKESDHVIRFSDFNISWIEYEMQPCDWGLPTQPISNQKAVKKKKSPQTFAHLMNFTQNLSATFHIFLLQDLRLVLCSLEVHMYYMYVYLCKGSQIIEVGKSDHMESKQQEHVEGSFILQSD